MKKIFFLLFIPSYLFAYKVAETPFQILYLPFGARASAMGGAFCALCDDITGLWANPAGLGQILRSQCYLTHQEWFMDFRDNYAGICLPVWYGGMFGGSLLYSTVGGIEGYTDENIRTKDFNVSETILLLGYGNELIIRNLFIGVALSLLYQNLAPRVAGLYGDKGKAVGVNFGLLYRWGKKLSIGCAIQNIGTPVYYHQGEKEKLPRNIKIGKKLSLFERLNLVADVNLPQLDIPYLQAGAEYWISKEYFCIRGGTTKELVKLKHKSELSPITFGFGIKYRDFLLDYAYAGFGILGMTHRITLSWIFGPPPVVPTGDVFVKVVDAEKYTPLPNAIVKIGGTIFDTAITSKEGEVSWREVPTGELWVKIEKDFYKPKEDTFLVFFYETTKKIYPLKYIGPKEIPSELAVKGIAGRIIVGEITEEGKIQPVPAIIRFKGPQEGVVETDNQGWYKIPDIKPGYYTLYIEAKGRDFFPEEIRNVVVEKDKCTLLHAGLKRVKILRLYFETDKAYIHPMNYGILDTLAEFMKLYKENDFEINGHTDPRRPKRWKDNMELSFARAFSVKNYLVKKGVEEERLHVNGFGETQPIAPNDTEEGMALNRRIEIIIKPPK